MTKVVIKKSSKSKGLSGLLSLAALPFAAKIGIGAGVAAVAGFLFYKGKSLIETADNINVELLGVPKIHSISLTQLVINVDLKVDNPAKQQVRVKLPSIRVYYRGSMIASTPVSDKEYTVNPVSSGKISGIKISVSLLSLLTSSIVSDVAAAISSKDTSKIIANLGFDVMAEVNGIPLKVQKLS
jgi:hypothetical protein